MKIKIKKKYLIFNYVFAENKKLISERLHTTQLVRTLSLKNQQGLYGIRLRTQLTYLHYKRNCERFLPCERIRIFST